MAKSKINKKKFGQGLLNRVIDKLPFEMHLPGGYQYCGPGTKLKKRLERGDPGINKLDQACKKHDIAYENPSNEYRKIADKDLLKEAWRRVKATDSSLKEKAAALAVVGAMNTKIGSGLKKKINKKQKPVIHEIIKQTKAELKKNKPNTFKSAIKIALKAAKTTIQQNKRNINKEIPRVIPVPKIGGVLPLIPIFAGLSALGSLIGGGVAVANAINTTNNAKKNLKESQRHNEMMEAIALGKQNEKGDGLYLKPYKKGLGVYVNQKTKNTAT